jgi:hypothetical protein
MRLTSDETDSASGLELEMKAPQFEGFANSPSEIRKASVTLPPGVNINPDAADGQTSCSDAEANFGTELPAACPDQSKIGNFDILTPALDGPLVGALYFGEPKPGNQYRVIMTADGFGIHAKLVAEVHPDPQTGQSMWLIQSSLPGTAGSHRNIRIRTSALTPDRTVGIAQDRSGPSRRDLWRVCQTRLRELIRTFI